MQEASRRTLVFSSHDVDCWSFLYKIVRWNKKKLLHGGTSIFCILILLLVAADSSAADKLKDCNIGHERPLHKRYVFDEQKQVDIPLTIGTTERISHRIASAVLEIFLDQFLGYHDVQVRRFSTTFDTKEAFSRLNSKSDMDLDVFNPGAIPSAMIDVELWIQPGFVENDYTSSMDCGSQGSGARFGWYIKKGNVKTHAIVDHWRSFLHPEITVLFSVGEEKLRHIRKTMTHSEGKYFCNVAECTEGMFIPDQCKNVSYCATLFVEHYSYSSFLITQVRDQQLLVQIVWIGRKLTPTFLENFQPHHHKVFFSWWPSTLSAMGGLLPVAFPPCKNYSVQFGEEDMNYLCKYELHTLKKHVWKKLKGEVAVETVQRFKLNDDDYRLLLGTYNSRVASLVNNNFLSMNSSWDDAIIWDIACSWLQNSTGFAHVWDPWIPVNNEKKRKLWIAGIFPVNDVIGSYSSRTLVWAAKLAVKRINQNPDILNEYELDLKVEDGRCRSDDVLNAFIKYVRTESFDSDLKFNHMVGILGPACSDTVEPLAGVAKHFDTIILSYSAEGAIFNDRKKYPYFFRTIPENKVYRYVYLQIFKQLGWKTVAALSEDGHRYSEYLVLLENSLSKEGIELENRKFPRDPSRDMSAYLLELKEKSHIIIGDFYANIAREVLCKAYESHMTAADGYVWFLPRWFTKDWYDTDKYNGKLAANDTKRISCTKQQMLKALDGHFSLGYAYYAPDESVYHEGLTVGDWKNQYTSVFLEPPADYAGYTYDAVWTYAFALDKLLKENLTHYANLHSNTTNGRFVELMHATNFTGVSGDVIFMNGSSRSTIVDIMQFHSHDLEYRLVGDFHPLPNDTKRGGILKLDESRIDWKTADNSRPSDGSNPKPCALAAFRDALGVTCEEAIVIVMFLGFGIITIIILVLFIFYKKRFERMHKPPAWPLDYMDEWEISPDKLIINRTIGEGAFGKVYGGECFFSDERGWVAVAVKTLKIGSTMDNKLDFLGEADMMRRFNHNNIVKLLGLCTQQEPIQMIMEFMLYGDLKTYLLARRHLVAERTTDSDEDDDVGSKRLTSMALDIAKALAYLVENNYVHRDVACRNCLVNADHVVKLSDFGMTRPMYESNYYRLNRKGILPVRWMAPESLEDGVYTPATDMWSYGVLIYEIITFGNFPFQSMTNNQVLEHVKCGLSLQIPSGSKPQLEQLLLNCWHKYPEERPTFKRVIDILENLPNLLTPCLELPLASVQINDTDTLQITVPELPCRRLSVPSTRPPGNRLRHPSGPECIAENNVSAPPSPINECPFQNLDSNHSFPTSVSDDFTCSALKTDKIGGPAMEPLLPLNSNSYITRYAHLQINSVNDCGGSGITSYPNTVTPV